MRCDEKSRLTKSYPLYPYLASSTPSSSKTPIQINTSAKMSGGAQQQLPTAAAAASAISSAFPAPPPFYKSFTPTNLALLAARATSAAPRETSDKSSHHIRPEESFFSTAEKVQGEEEEGASVVGELAHLVPPLPPLDGKYRSFGILYDVCMSLSPHPKWETTRRAKKKSFLLKCTISLPPTFAPKPR